MNADRLLTALAQVGDTHERIQQLRKIAVALAISGRLDTPEAMSADQLRAAVERARDTLVRRGALPRHKTPSDVSEDQLPEKFTDRMRFVRLGALARIEKGQTGIQQAAPGPFPLVVTAAERSSCDHYDFDGAATIIPLVSSTGHGDASLNRLHYQDGRFALGTILAAVFPHDPSLVSARFLFEYLSAFKDELLVSRMSGTANVTLTLGVIAEVPIPLVCPDVQAKVDELMALCDELEAARTAREAARDRLAAASLARLNSPDPETFPADARFAFNAMPDLTARADQISRLRQTILRLGLRGKLMPQDDSDEPASALLARIRSQRNALLQAGYPNADEARTQLRKQEVQAIPNGLAELPAGWTWATLQQCSVLVIDCKNKTAPYAANGIKLVRTTNVRNGKLNSIDQKYVDERTYEIWSARCKPEPGDILITREAPMGEVCIIPTWEQICLGQRMMLARLLPDTLDRDFMLYSLRDPDLMERIQDKPIGATVQHLRVGGVETLLVPVPPLAEQRRIVAKLDTLMTLCDELEASLAAADSTRRGLLDALLAEALTPALAEAA